MAGERGGPRPLSGTVAEHYRIERLIGAGGMGAVYQATDTRLHRTVALKALLPQLTADPTTLERFRREARLACRVAHPYVATVFDVAQHRDQLLIVMEYLEGDTLGAVLRSGQPTRESLGRWILEIGEALAEIHRAGIVHRDIKPGNVMITESGHAKVTDFGLARAHPQVRPDQTTLTVETELTRSGGAIGTVLYMSPEQLRGEAVDPRSDQFAFGVVTYEALTGVHPFNRGSVAESMGAILGAPPSGGDSSPTWRASEGLRSVVSRMLAKKPAERFPDSDQALVALRAALVDLQTPPDNAAKWRRRGLGAAAVLLTLLVVGGIGLRAWLRQPPVWDRARYGIAVAPFLSTEGDGEARLEAALLTDLLTRDLQASRLMRAEGPEELQLAGLYPQVALADLGVKTASARATDYVILGTLQRDGSRWRVHAEARASREGRRELPPIDASGDGALELAETLAAAVRRRLPDVSRLTALRDDRVDLTALTSASADARRAYERGVLALREGRLVNAIEALEQATELDAGFALAFARMADALDGAGYSRRAREAADQARDRLPRRPAGLAEERLELSVRASRARILGRQEDWINAAEALAARFPDEPALLKDQAAALGAAQQFTEALQVLDRAVQLDARNPGLRTARAAVLSDLARYDEAGRALDEAHAVYTLLGSDEGLATVDTLRGQVHQDRELYDQAFESYARAAGAYAAAGRPVSAAETWLAARTAMLARGDVAGAEARILEAESVARETGNHKLLSESLTSRGVLETYRRDWEAAIRNYKAAIDEARLLENTRLRMSPLGNLASLLVWLRRIEEALPLFEEFEAAAEELGQRDAVQVTLINQAEIAHQLGDLEAAARSYDKLLGVAGATPERMILLGHLGLAGLDRERGRYGSALDHLERAVTDARALRRPLNLGRALLNRARLYSMLGRDDAADRDAEEVVPLSADLPDLAKALRGARARFAFDRGQFKAALTQATAEALDQQASARLLACAAAQRAGAHAEAVRHCEAVVEMERATPSDRAEARAWLGSALLERGDAAAAARHAREALEAGLKMGLLLPQARAAATLARMPEADRQDSDRDGLSQGREALAALREAAPEADRERLFRRPDLAQLHKELTE